MTIQRDIVLLLWSESEIDAGLAMLSEAYASSDYDSAIWVLSESPKTLVEQVKSRIQKQCPQLAGHCTVSEMTSDVQELSNELRGNAELRLLLMPGLDQIKDVHRHLFKNLDVSVVCYQNHQSISQPAKIDYLVDEDVSGTVHSLRSVLGTERPIQKRTFDELLIAANSEAPAKSDLATDPVTQKSLEELKEHSIGNVDQEQTAGEAEREVREAQPWHLISSPADSWEGRLKQARQLMEKVSGPVFLIRAEKGWGKRALRSRWLRKIVSYIPQMDREQRKQVSDELNRESKPSFDFLALICASSFLAAFGLAQDSAAVIIGAMLVAPLMSPILAAGLALAQGNPKLFGQSMTTLAIGFFAALMAGTLFGFLMQLMPNSVLHRTDEGFILTKEMWSRTYPGSLDFLVGLVGGSAAAFARTRRELSSALAGAAIAAALVPPIATAGIQLSLCLQPIKPHADHELTNLVLGPSLLFFANMLTIMIGSSFVLWACGTRGVHDHSSKERWTIRMIALLATITVLVFVWIVQHNR